jgi:hypothetical protein
MVKPADEKNGVAAGSGESGFNAIGDSHTSEDAERIGSLPQSFMLTSSTILRQDNRDLLMKARNFVTTKLQIRDSKLIKTGEPFKWYRDKK